MRQCVILCVIAIIFLCGNTALAQPQYAFRVSFTDKNGAPPLTSPLTFLSQRALDRRNAQSLTTDSTDRPVSPDYVDSVLTLTGGKFHLTSRWLNYVVVLLTDSSQMLQLQSKPYISKTEYIGYYSPALHKNKLTIPLPSFLKGTGSEAYYGKAYTQTAIVNGDYLHDLGYKGQGKLIAVLDEGFDGINGAPGFDSMNAGGRLLDQYDFVKASPVVNTIYDHGSNALSLIAGNIPGTFVGSAPNAQYAVYATEIRTSEQYLEMDNLLAATERADSLGADIVSVSLGYNSFQGPASPNLTYADINGSKTIAAKAANIATTKGILFVASAGNEGGNSWNYILTPGDADSAITIGSADAGKNVASNSGYGPNSSGRRKPDVCMMGAPASFLRAGNTTASEHATSWATPQLAGWAACLWQAVGASVTPFQLKQAIISSAHMYTTPDNHSGYGVPDFKKAFELLKVKDIPGVPAAWVTLTPNPAEEHTTVQIYLSKKSDIAIRITDITGKLVYTATQALDSGLQKQVVPVTSLASGVYLLKVVADDKEAVVRMVKR
jgi:hypothetical protein